GRRPAIPLVGVLPRRDQDRLGSDPRDRPGGSCRRRRDERRRLERARRHPHAALGKRRRLGLEGDAVAAPTKRAYATTRQGGIDAVTEARRAEPRGGARNNRGSGRGGGCGCGAGLDVEDRADDEPRRRLRHLRDERERNRRAEAHGHEGLRRRRPAVPEWTEAALLPKPG